MRNLFEYKIEVFYDDEDEDFVAFIKEIPSLSVYAPSPEKALKKLEEVFEDYCLVQEEDGDPIVKPFGGKEYSGTIYIRAPKSLHRRLAERAAEEGVSLNQEAIFCLTKGLAS